MASNFDTLTELPPWEHIIAKSGAISFELLPLDLASNKGRQIRPICNKCPINSTKRLLPLKNQYNYKSATNYISHLYHHHKTTWEELGFNKSTKSSSIASSSKSSTTGPLDQLVTQRQKPLYTNTINSKELARLTIRFIVANNLSFRTALSPTYKQLIQRLNSDILPPTQHSLYQEIEAYYNEQLDLFKQKLYLHITQNKGTFTLCLDGWTSANNKSYLGITIHWINPKDWTLESYILRLQNLHKKHSGENLNKALINVLKEFNIQNNIFCITRDNAYNNDTLIKDFKEYNKANNGLFYSDIRCIAHIINLIVQDILKELKGQPIEEELLIIEDDANNATKNNEEQEESSNKRKRQNTQNEDQLVESLPELPLLITETGPISLIKKVRLQIYKLRNIQRLISTLSEAIIGKNLPRKIKRPQLDMPVRWNSTFNMLDQYIAIKPAIDLVILQYPNDFKNITLSNDEITQIKELIDVLFLFSEASIEVQSDNKPILMLTILTTTELYQYINKTIRTTKWKDLKKGLLLGRKKLNKYFPQKIEASKYDIYSFAILLDPRLKEQFFREELNWTNYDISFLRDRFKVLWLDYKKRYRPEGPIIASESSSQDLEAINEEERPKSLTQRLYKRYMDANELTVDNKEVDAYISEARCPADTLPAKWWQIYGQKYPILSLIAQDYLAIIASSAAIEREFSKLADIANNKKRGRLSARRVNQLISLKS